MRTKNLLSRYRHASAAIKLALFMITVMAFNTTAMAVDSTKISVKNVLELRHQLEHATTAINNANIACLVIILIAVVLGIRLYYMNRTLKRRKALGEQLQAERNRAVHNNKLKTQYIGNMADGIRSSLIAIEVNLDSIVSKDRKPTEKELETSTASIRQNCRMVRMVIDDIMNLADVEVGYYALRFASYNLNRLCNDIFALVQYRVPKGVELSLRCKLPISYNIYTDSHRVQQVLVNLLVNACKHTSQGSITLECSVDATPGYISFAVADTGTGVDPEHVANIIKSSTDLDEVAEGAGNGLRLCANITERFNGKLWCDRNYQGGARFVFEIPLIATPT